MRCSQNFHAEIIMLNNKPKDIARRYTAFMINRFHFHTRGLEMNRKYQNNDVVVAATTTDIL